MARDRSAPPSHSADLTFVIFTPPLKPIKFPILTSTRGKPTIIYVLQCQICECISELRTLSTVTTKDLFSIANNGQFASLPSHYRRCSWQYDHYLDSGFHKEGLAPPLRFILHVLGYRMDGTIRFP